MNRAAINNPIELRKVGFLGYRIVDDVFEEEMKYFGKIDVPI
jgi:hypothetical protein